LQITVTTAAKVAQPTAPPKEYISIERPKPKKNMAPKKSLKSSTTASICFIYFESANTRPAPNTPMASAKRIDSEKPAMTNSKLKTSNLNSPKLFSCNTRSIKGTSLRPKIRNDKINPKAINEVSNTAITDVPPVNISPDKKDMCMAIKRSSNIIIPMITS